MASINVDQLSMELLSNLDLYVSHTVETVTEAVDETAAETVRELNRTSPVGATGDYSKSWAHKRDPTLKGKFRYSRVVYAKKPEYRLTHLLEKPHAKVNGGRVEARPHIAKAEQFARDRLFDKLIEKLPY